MQITKYKKHCGQVGLEYALSLIIVTGICTMLYVFYQALVQANVYGSADQNNALYRLGSDKNPYVSLGLNRVVALP